MSLWEIYKAKRIGASTDSLFSSLLGRKSGKPYAWAIEKAPYSLRTSANGADIAPSCIDKIVGGTIAWNQLVQNGNFTSITGWEGQAANAAVNDNICTITVSQAKNGVALRAVGINALTDHVYVALAKINPTKAGRAMFYLSGTSSATTDLVANKWNAVGGVVKPSSTTGGFNIYCNRNTVMAVGDTCQYKEIQLFDVTLMFGSAVANRIQTLETANAGAGVAWFKALFDTDKYYSYNAGTLMSVNASAHVMRDADNNVIGNYELDETLTLRGLPKLDSNNNLYYDGDAYESDGSVTRKYGIVDMGTVDWIKINNVNRFYTTAITGHAKTPFNSNPSPCICGKYVSVGPTSGASTAKSITFTNDSDNVYVTDAAYSDENTFKTAMSGVYLVYELATPSSETAEPFTNPQRVSKDGTEEYVDYAVSHGDREVSIPVGHETEYKMFSE